MSSVIVAVSAAHREEAFAAAREIIDRIKSEAPIWKKEVEARRSAGSRERERGMPDPELEQRMRALPSVEELLQTEPLRTAAATRPTS